MPKGKPTRTPWMTVVAVAAFIGFFIYKNTAPNSKNVSDSHRLGELMAKHLKLSDEQQRQIYNELSAIQTELEPSYDHEFPTPAVNYFNRLQRLLFASQLLPAGKPGTDDFFGRLPTVTKPSRMDADGLYEGVGMPYYKTTGTSGLSPWLTRESIDRFWAKTKSKVPIGSTCLEHEVAYLSPLNKNCKRVIEFAFSQDPGTPRLDEKARKLFGDFSTMNMTNMKSLAGTYDAIVSTNTIQYALDFNQILTIYKTLLKKDGLLYVTVPWLEATSPDDITDLNWASFYRFSYSAMKKILENQGFEITESYIGGSQMLMLSFLTGYSTLDFSASELESLVIPVEQGMVIPPYYYVSMFIAKKL